MDAFESLIEMLLRQDGYWTRTSFKVNLTPADKRAIGRPSAPRWEIDVVAYKGETNEILAVECKSFLDSPGVKFRNGKFEPEKRYKLFSDERLRTVVLRRLSKQLVEMGAVRPRPSVTLCLAAGHVASVTNRELFRQHMAKHRWTLLDEQWILAQLSRTADADYEDDVAHVVSKLIIRKAKGALTLP